MLWTDRNVEADAERWRILVVDHNAASAEGLAATLSADGCDARYVLSGMDTLQAIDGWVPHVVILDISMPEHDGFATAQVLRRISPTRNAGIIAFTARGKDYVRSKGFYVGLHSV
ncbi:Chemotaxis protein methyltransferase CheR [Candidatus Burkholderia crenata]|nr:Chemotaxis protein methyltransferase CheR [Candidatus Burkholderia crenata]